MFVLAKGEDSFPVELVEYIVHFDIGDISIEFQECIVLFV